MARRTNQSPLVIEPPPAAIASRPDDVETRIDELRNHYTFAESAEVTAYLREFPKLIPILEEARQVIPHYFGPEAPLLLHVFDEPAWEVHWLFLTIQAHLPVAEELARMDRLDEEWWFERSPNEPGVLVLDVA